MSELDGLITPSDKDQELQRLKVESVCLVKRSRALLGKLKDMDFHKAQIDAQIELLREDMKRQ
jgi:hypothetical protein